MVLASSAGGLRAEVKDNPYQVIVTRNAFALKPPPPPVDPTKNEPPPSPVDVLLTGISTLSGTKKALLQITDKSPSKAGKTDFPPPLEEGDVQGRVEVVSIDAVANQVLIKIDGNEKTLSFEDKDAPKPGAAPPPGARPGAPGMPGMPGGPRGPGMPGNPGYPLPTPGQPGVPMPMAGGAIPAPGAAAGGYGGVVVGGGGGSSGTATPGVPTPAASAPGSVTLGGFSAAPAPANLPLNALRARRGGVDAGGSAVVVGGSATPGAGATPAVVPALPPPPPLPR